MDPGSGETLSIIPTEFSSTLALVASYVTCVLRTSPPKRFWTQDELRPIIVFSDGAWGPTSDRPAGGGLVLTDPVKNEKKVAEINIDARLDSHWRTSGKSQLIAVLELLPIAVGLHHFSHAWKGRRVLRFVDNNSVRDMITKGTTSSPPLFCLLAECFRLAGSMQLVWWVSRVPTKSNIADFPSRQEPETTARMIDGQVIPPIECSTHFVEACLSVTSFVDYMQMVAESCKRNGFESDRK